MHGATQKGFSVRGLLGLAFSGLLLCPACDAKASAPGPTSLEECYMRVALEKTTADMVYLAREICDRVFGARPRSVVFLEPKSDKCVERWFDAKGRYEDGHQHCAFERLGADQWGYACQNKHKTSYTHVRLKENGSSYAPIGDVIGEDPGPMFKRFGACVEALHNRNATAGR